MPEAMAKAIANPLFPALDSALRAGRHIGSDDMDNHAYLVEFEAPLSQFYLRYNVELVRAPEHFFYLRPRSTTLIGRSVLSELDMLIGKVLCYLYLSPERLAQEGQFAPQDVFEELLTLVDTGQLMRMVTLRATGSDVDRDKLHEKMRVSLRRLRRIGMILPIADSDKFRISEAVFRFGADVRSGEDPLEAQRRLLSDGEISVSAAREAELKQAAFESSDRTSMDHAPLHDTAQDSETSL
ncbi:Chromosome partition protein MukE [Vibrio stylophorae]|uniref:Chromosome partition protein MukE n=2 Tax=Vibrio stylophorae TaxID=659351 RepID=A0ABM8ZTJ2_9VIBR|nr:Chromosome partition protein MukE [Vibrio stylophorae]